MKKTRRIAAMVAAMALAATMAVPFSMTASAVETVGFYSPTSGTDTLFDVSIADTRTGHTYVAYQIFKTTNGAEDISGSAGSYTLSNLEISDKVTVATLVAELKKLKKDEDNALFSDTLLPAGTTDAAKIAEAMSDSDVKSALAADKELQELFAKAIKASFANDKTGTTLEAIEGGYAADLGVPGYYFIADETTGTTDAISQYILQVVGPTQDVAVKADQPTLDKFILHNEKDADNNGATNSADGGWEKVGDNQIGDTVYFYTKTSVPDTSYFETYTYTIRDAMSDGLTFISDQTITITYKAKNASSETPIATIAADTKTVTYNSTTFASGSEPASGTIALTVGDDTNTGDQDTPFVEDFYLNINLKDAKLAAKAEAGGEFYVYYSATLNKDALVSLDENSTQYNTNTAYLTYSNDANADGSGDTTTKDTPKVTVYDWTFATDTTKVSAANTPLTGAGFSLYDTNPSSGTPTAISLVEVTDVDTLKTALGDNSLTSIESGTRYYRIATSASEAGAVTEIFKNADNSYSGSKFIILGLDDTKNYWLKETKIPQGYNGIDPIQLSLTAAYDANDGTGEGKNQISGNDLTTLTAKYDGATTAVLSGASENSMTDTDTTFQILNTAGSVLPSTGGIGTTLFVVGGGVTMAAAGIYLVSKKRAKDAE